MKYTGELKLQKLSVRVTDEVYAYILSFPGKHLSDKFHALIRLSMQNGSPECMNHHVGEIEESIEQIKHNLESISKNLKRL